MTPPPAENRQSHGFLEAQKRSYHVYDGARPYVRLINRPNQECINRLVDNTPYRSLD